MIKKISALFILICLSLSACSKEQIKKPEESGRIMQFFTTFEDDLVNTSKVIAANELIKNLTHLQKMDYGGNRYYPLERDALTKMIQSLSSYTYAECLLINSSGTVIYSMYDDGIFSKKAESFQNSLGILFRHCKEGEPYILDVSEFPELIGGKRLYFGMPVKLGNEVKGVLIAVLDAGEVLKQSSIEYEAVDANGIIRVSSHTDQILTENSAVKSAAAEAIGPDITVETAEGPRSYRAMTFRNLRWFIREKK